MYRRQTGFSIRRTFRHGKRQTDAPGAADARTRQLKMAEHAHSNPPLARAAGAQVLPRVLAVAAAAVAYAVLAHMSNSTANANTLGTVLAVGPVLFISAALAWRSPYRLPALLICALAAALMYSLWPLLEQHFSVLFLLQQVSVYSLLGLTFGRTLTGDRVPLCTQWATLVHGVLPQSAVRYTRSVTAAWTLFFAIISITLITLFVLAPLPVWSAFANFCTFPLVGALFVVEYIVRRRALPDMKRAHILDGARAYLASSRGTPTERLG